MTLKLSRILNFVIILLQLPLYVYADGWISSQPSHSTLYADTLTSKTDASPVSIADSQGLFVTGNITTLGKIGVGTTSPDSNLAIGSADASNVKMSLRSNAATFSYSGMAHNSVIIGAIKDGSGLGHAQISLGYANSGRSIQLGTASDANFDSSTTFSPLLTIKDTGNVGIGTTNPQAKLHINDADTVGAYMNVLALGNGGATYQWHFRHWGGSTEAADRLELSTHAFTPLMVWKGNGNVGIGTTAPGNKLDVVGNGDNGVEIRSDDNLGTAYLELDSAEVWRLESLTGGLFQINDASAGQVRLAIKTDGNVGIGTTSPGYRLEVAGTIKSENINNPIWSTGASGSYSLRTIFDTARNNGLVPGVYDCVLRTSNNAHWTGRRFTATVNFYINNPSYPHRFYGVIDINAGSSGCSGGLTSFNDATGDFTFDSGNCNQNIGLVCNRLY